VTDLGVDTLANALSQLEMALDYARSESASHDAKLAQLFRSASIQAFEFTYELSHKVLRRYLAATEASPPTVEKLSFPDLIRLGYDRGVVARDWKYWHEYRRLRALTSHTYAEVCAAEVFETIPGFIEDIRQLITAMREAPPP